MTLRRICPDFEQYPSWHGGCYRQNMRIAAASSGRPSPPPADSTPAKPLLLLVEDEPSMCAFLRASFSSRGYRLIEAGTGAEGLSAAASRNPDLILLDLGLPDMDGLEVAQRLRDWATTPIIVLSARGMEEDKILALDAGANDYLTKPFSTGELAARIRVALKYSQQSSQLSSAPILTAGDIRIDLAQHSTFVGDREVHLTPTEFKLCATLMKHAGRVLTHRQLLEQVWGPEYANNTQYLRVYMVQLRHKLEADPTRPRYLLTVPAVGYRMKANW